MINSEKTSSLINTNEKASFNKTIGLVVCIPFSMRPVVPEWAVALACQNYPMNMNHSMILIGGKEADDARNIAAQRALDNGADYLFFLDDDVQPPFHAIRQLYYRLAQDKDAVIATGIYATKDKNPEPLIYRGNGGGAFWDWKKDTVFEITGCGTGCMMIKTEIFKKLEKPWFRIIDNFITEGDNITQTMTEDLYFCDKVVKAGGKIIADGGILCRHWDVKTMTAYSLANDSYPMKDDVDISKAKKIEGWMSDMELTWLAKQAKNHKVIVELGSYLGRSTRAMADNTNGIVYAIDDWLGVRDKEVANPERFNRDSLFDEFKANMNGLLESKKVSPIRGNHKAVCVPGIVPDMVFVDGSHQYEDVMANLTMWLPKGLICGHDYDWPEVKKAVDEVLGEVKVVEGTSIWYKEVA